MGKAVTGETCPQYLFLDKILYSRPGVDGALPVCAPPLREKADQEYLWEALGAGTLQTIGSDHCPFTAAEKQAGMNRFDTIPGGVPSIEIRYPSLYAGGVRTGRMTLQQWVDLCSTAPARLLGLERKGDIASGFDADLVIFDPDKELHVRPETLHETAGWSPYEGMAFKGWPETVISRGNIIVDRGKFVASPGHGRFIE
jgi:dihydropyrimidinase